MDVDRYPAVSTAGDVMSSPAITVAVGATRSGVADLLIQHRISGVPVVDAAGRVVGLISDSDLLAKTGDDVDRLMTRGVISVTVDTSLDDVRHLLLDRRIRRVPVLSEGRLVGLVSRSDLVAIMATEWVCGMCGEPVRGAAPPERCPKCHTGREKFSQQEQPPGA